jgi:hypothetical protein
MPAYDAIRLDEAGNLWVEDYDPDGDGGCAQPLKPSLSLLEPIARGWS